MDRLTPGGPYPIFGIRLYSNAGTTNDNGFPNDTSSNPQFGSFLFIDIDVFDTADKITSEIIDRVADLPDITQYLSFSKNGGTLTITSNTTTAAITLEKIFDNTYNGTGGGDNLRIFSADGSPSLFTGDPSVAGTLDFNNGIPESAAYYTTGDETNIDSHGFAPFTPPFLDKNSDPYVEIKFTPTTATGGTKEYTMQEVIENSAFTYYNFKEAPTNHASNTNYTEAMSINASLNLGILTSLKTDNLETTPEGKPFISEEENPNGLVYNTDIKVDDNNKLHRWVMQTKWETPVLDFTSVKVSALNTTTGLEQFVSGSPWKTRYWDKYYSLGARLSNVTSGDFLTGSTGMWHQKGQLIDEESTIVGASNRRKGYFLNIEDSSNSSHEPLATKLGFIGYREENNLVKSLKKPKEYRRQIGLVEDRKVIKEAVVAIPLSLIHI